MIKLEKSAYPESDNIFISPVQLGFFKRKYEKMTKNPEEMDETMELNS